MLETRLSQMVDELIPEGVSPFLLSTAPPPDWKFKNDHELADPEGRKGEVRDADPPKPLGSAPAIGIMDRDAPTAGGSAGRHSQLRQRRSERRGSIPWPVSMIVVVPDGIVHRRLSDCLHCQNQDRDRRFGAPGGQGLAGWGCARFDP